MAGNAMANTRFERNVVQAMIAPSIKIFFSTGPDRLITESDAGTPLVDDLCSTGSHVCALQTKPIDEVT